MQVFVAYPYIKTPLHDYRANFHRVEKSLDYVKFVFADEKVNNDTVLTHIRQEIVNSDLCLFDITHWNPNVALELGLAIGLNRPHHILFNSEADKSSWRTWFGLERSDVIDVPADLRGIRRLNYRDAGTLEAGIVNIVKSIVESDTGLDVQRHWQLLRMRVRSVVEQSPGLHNWELANRLGMEPGQFSAHLKDLRESGEVVSRGRGASTRYWLASAVPADVPEDGQAVNPRIHPE